MNSYPMAVKLNRISILIQIYLASSHLSKRKFLTQHRSTGTTQMQMTIVKAKLFALLMRMKKTAS